jgi:RNA polymerase sigma-70 factor, ECF subfamily
MMSDPTDVDLMIKIRQGEKEAFALLIRRHQKPLINFIHRLIGNPAEAEDLAQEVFLKVYQAAPRYEPQASFSTWLYRIATNTTLTFLRDHKPHMAVSFDEESDEGVGIASTIADTQPLAETKILEAEKVSFIHKAIVSLPENQRLALILTKYQNLSLKEAAEVLHCSETAVKSLIFRAYSLLREKLAPVAGIAIPKPYPTEVCVQSRTHGMIESRGLK